MNAFVSVVLIVFAAFAPCFIISVHADNIYINARIYTANVSQPWAESVVIRDRRFVYVGNSETALEYRDKSTTIFDLEGKMVMPGIHDAHTHMMWAGLSELFQCRLTRDLSFDAIIVELENCAQEYGPSDWLVADSVWSSQFPGGQYHKSLLDKAFPDKPVYLADGSYHHAFLNSKALELAGINSQTPNPSGGLVVLDSNGEPTGELVESATSLVAKYLPAHSAQEEIDAMRWSSSVLSSFGITSTQEASADKNILTALQSIDKDRELHQRIATHIVWGSQQFSSLSETQVESLIQERKRFASDNIDTDNVKIFVDGSPTLPYSTEASIDPKNGDVELDKLLIQPELLSEVVKWMDDLGIKVKLHVAGAGSAHVALDAISAAREANPHSTIRHELGHSATLLPADILRLKDLNVVAEMSPTLWHRLPDTMGTPPLRAWQFRTMAERGVLMTLGTDWSVTENANVFPALQGMLDRGDESLDLDSALRVLTINGAISMGWERDQGSIEPGKLANMIVIDRNLFEVPITQVSETIVLRTVFEGSVVYDRLADR